MILDLFLIIELLQNFSNIYLCKLDIYKYKIINIYENNSCPRGEIGRHKGLKILALLGVPVRVWPRAP